MTVRAIHAGLRLLAVAVVPAALLAGCGNIMLRAGGAARRGSRCG